MSEIVAPRTVAFGVGGSATKIDADVEHRRVIGFPGSGQGLPEAIVGGTGGQMDSQRSGGIKVLKRALSGGPNLYHALRSGSPRLGGRGAVGLQFEVPIQSHDGPKLFVELGQLRLTGNRSGQERFDGRGPEGGGLGRHMVHV